MLLGLGCSPTGGGGDAGFELTEWLGSDPHFRAQGHLNGEDLDLSVEGDAATATKVFCEREYEVPQDGSGNPDYANGEMVEVKLHAFVSVAGEEREAEIELKRHDMSADAVGARLNVVPRDDASSPAANELYLEWEWKDSAGEDLFEKAAQTGTVTVEEFTGQVDDTGLLIPDNEGTVGVFVTAEWSQDESMTFSFAGPCGPNTVGIIE